MPALDWSFLFVVATLLLTPGPTNTLLASAGLARGLAPALRLLPVECLGYLLATTLWGLLMQGLVLKFPAVRQLVQLLSSLYLARLGWRMYRQAATSNPASTGGVGGVGGLQLFTATLLNPKAALFATALFPAVTWLHVCNYLRVQASFLALVAGIGALWIALGAALLQGRWTWLAPQRFQRLAALAVIAFSGWLLVQALRV